MSPPVSPPSPAVVQAIAEVLDYLYCDQRAHFLGSPPEQREDHIFVSLLIISCWLAGQTHSHEDF